jgi:hypothetical protein
LFKYVLYNEERISFNKLHTILFQNVHNGYFVHPFWVDGCQIIFDIVSKPIYSLFFDHIVFDLDNLDYNLYEGFLWVGTQSGPWACDTWVASFENISIITHYLFFKLASLEDDLGHRRTFKF